MRATSTPTAGHNKPFLSVGQFPQTQVERAQFERARCGACGRVFGTTVKRNKAGTTSCPHCQLELSLGERVGGTVMGTPLPRHGRTVPPPPVTPAAPPIPSQIELRTSYGEQNQLYERRFPLLVAIIGGVGLLIVSGVIFAAVVAFVVLERPSVVVEKEDIVTEIQLSDAERSQAERDRTKAANRQVQNDILQLESQSRTLENELMQLRKSVL